MESIVLLRLILDNPGIYLHELQSIFVSKFGIVISLTTVCRTLRGMGCTCQAMHHVALQRSDVLRARFMSEISVFDPSMLVFLEGVTNVIP